MRTDLEDLPEEKRKDLRRFVELTLGEFGDEIEMLILFGSYARGDWVEESAPDGVRFQYQSDYDIMVVTRDKASRHTLRWAEVEKAFARLLAPSLQRQVVTINFLNRMLERGYFFYVDIATEGIALYDSGRCALAKPRMLTPAEALEKARAHYDTWFGSALSFLGCYELLLARNDLNIAAFQLHQVTERALAAFLLVRTDYKPKTHDLATLVPLAASQNVEVLKVFPKGTQLEERRFELLRKAYVDARYEPTYTITREELDYLAGRVQFLLDWVQKTCQEQLARLKAEAQR